MSDRLLRENARIYYLPFVLGRGSDALGVCARIFFRSGVVPFICDTRPSLAAALCPFCKSITLSSTDSPRLLAEQLTDIARQDPYTLPILVPIDKKYRGAVRSQHSTLERSFVISDADSLFASSPFADMLKMISRQ